MQCVVCFEDMCELHFRACCREVLCQACLDDITGTGGICLCNQQVRLGTWESRPACIKELAIKLLEQVHVADDWFWSTQHREFVDMPSWEDYLRACQKSLVDYVRFLDRMESYYRQGKYPAVDEWTFEQPGVMYYAQVYSQEIYDHLVEDGMRQIQQLDENDSSNTFENLKIQTPEICIAACTKNLSNIFYVKELTPELYTNILDTLNSRII